MTTKLKTLGPNRLAAQPCTVLGTIHENTHQDVIQVTADRAHLYLDDWRRKIETRGSWKSPLSLAVTLLITLLTVDFQDRFGLSKEGWFALFVAGSLVSVLGLVCAVIRCIRNPAEAADRLVERFMNGTP